VFPTNARASGFGLCQAAGRIAAFVAIPAFLWIQQGYGLNAVFVVIAVIAAIAITQSGPRRGASPSTKLPRQPGDANIRQFDAVALIGASWLHLAYHSGEEPQHDPDFGAQIAAGYRRL
jgi:hypothetical protein